MILENILKKMKKSEYNKVELEVNIDFDYDVDEEIYVNDDNEYEDEIIIYHTGYIICKVDYVCLGINDIEKLVENEDVYTTNFSGSVIEDHTNYEDCNMQSVVGDPVYGGDHITNGYGEYGTLRVSVKDLKKNKVLSMF